MRGPLPVTKNRYVVEMGGFSDDLRETDLGINQEEVFEVNIEEGMGAIVKKMDHDQVPLLYKSKFQLKYIDKSSPRDYKKSIGGRVLFPGCLEKNLENEINRGDDLILNTGYDNLSSSWVFKLWKKTKIYKNQ